MADSNDGELEPSAPIPKFEIFRAKDARSLMDMGIMSVDFPTDMRPLISQATESGLLKGDEERVLFHMPGFSLIHVWLKKNYPLSLHTHDSDCLYCIISGALRLGNEVLGKGDGFFIPANVPYTYVPVGENGVEVLEFRHAVSFDFKSRSKGLFWNKAIETCKTNSESWGAARSPLEIVTSQDKITPSA